MSWLKRLQDGLSKTRKAVQQSFKKMTGTSIDPEDLEEVEAALLQADMGVRTVSQFMETVKEQAGGFQGATPLQVLRTLLMDILKRAESDHLVDQIRKGPQPFILLMIGINGVGKTTTMAKLGHRFIREGLKPLFVAGETFRAAAIEQLEIWGQRSGIEVIRHQQGSDPAAVVYDGIMAAKARKADVVLIDTAGRLHTKVNLMDELKKIKRIIHREMAGAPHEVLLVLDGTLGQNTIAQARQFHEALGVTGLALTKLDGTSRGGVVVAIVQELDLPIRLIGVGESAEDLQDFQAEAFVNALLPTEQPLD